jgi:hypothetical protein
MAVSVALLSEFLLTVLASEWFLVQMDSEVVLEAAHLRELMHAVVALKNLVGAACLGVVLVYLHVVLLQLVLSLRLLDSLAGLADRNRYMRNLRLRGLVVFVARICQVLRESKQI